MSVAAHGQRPAAGGGCVRRPAAARAQPAGRHAGQGAEPVAPRAGDRTGGTIARPSDASGDDVDYTQIPVALDRKFEQLDLDSALRPTIINPGAPWERTFKKSLLADAADEVLDEDARRTEKDKAFDLIDALSKSGDLAFEEASLHVVIAATHCFDQTLLDTVIQGNVNPVEKVERSSMIVATTIHDRPAIELIVEDQQPRFFATSPGLAALPLGEAPD